MKMLTAIWTGFLATGLCAVTSNVASAATPGRVFQTGFDCSTATAKVEKLICRDPQLARMDVELRRLYRLALTDQRSVPPPDKVMNDQQFWILARNQCATDVAPKACTIRRYAERAYQLRQGSAIVRTKDPDRLTEGPLTFRCTGLNTPIAATFFNAGPDVVFLKWANTSVTLSEVPSDSGLRYSGKDSLGYYSFWQTDAMAVFQKPGSSAMRCTVEPAG